MRARGWRRPAAAAVVLACLSLAGCGESEETTASPDVLPGSPQDPCRLLSQSDAASILGVSDVQPGQAATRDECSYSSADGANSLVFDIENKSVFDLALAQSKRLGTAVDQVPLGDQAFYYTPLQPGSSPSPAATPTPSPSASPSPSAPARRTGSARTSPSPSLPKVARGAVITYLKVRKGSNYYAVLVKKGETYDPAAEFALAQKLLRS